MNLDPWKFFFIIITNLSAILFIYLFYKSYSNKSNSHANKVLSQNENDNEIETSQEKPVCPFMAAFKNAKLMDDSKKRFHSKKEISKSSDVDTGISHTQKITTEESKLAPLESNLSESSNVPPKECKVEECLTKNSTEKSKTNFEKLDISTENIKANLTSNLKKATSPEEIKSFYEHIPAHVKQLEQEKLMMTLKPEEREEEVKVRHSQLEQIYKLMGEKSDLFGISSFDEIHDQMKLYVQ